jgi:hypothetical protein
MQTAGTQRLKENLIAAPDSWDQHTLDNEGMVTSRLGRRKAICDTAL